MTICSTNLLVYFGNFSCCRQNVQTTYLSYKQRVIQSCNLHLAGQCHLGYTNYSTLKQQNGNNSKSTLLRKAMLTKPERAVKILSHVFVSHLFIVMLAGCNSSSQLGDEPADQLSSIDINGYSIPHLASPQKQLAYANSSLGDVKKRTAALQAVESLYPTDKRHCGLAAIELAYSLLGGDYRLAGQEQYKLAHKQYLFIVEKFSDIDDVSSKALWYLGWISTELLQDKEAGLTFYQAITAIRPSPRLKFADPAPWLSILPGKSSTSHEQFLTKSHITWADLAHLEIIRNAANMSYTTTSLADLYEKYPAGLITGLGIKIQLTHQGLDTETEKIAAQYLSHKPPHDRVKQDILALQQNKQPLKGIQLPAP